MVAARRIRPPSTVPAITPPDKVAPEVWDDVAVAALEEEEVDEGVALVDEGEEGPRQVLSFDGPTISTADDPP